jgi:hypothetical protein
MSVPPTIPSTGQPYQPHVTMVSNSAANSGPSLVRFGGQVVGPGGRKIILGSNVSPSKVEVMDPPCNFSNVPLMSGDSQASTSPIMMPTASWAPTNCQPSGPLTSSGQILQTTPSSQNPNYFNTFPDQFLQYPIDPNSPNDGMSGVYSTEPVFQLTQADNYGDSSIQSMSTLETETYLFRLPFQAGPNCANGIAQNENKPMIYQQQSGFQNPQFSNQQFYQQPIPLGGPSPSQPYNYSAVTKNSFLLDNSSRHSVANSSTPSPTLTIPPNVNFSGQTDSWYSFILNGLGWGAAIRIKHGYSDQTL